MMKSGFTDFLIEIGGSKRIDATAGERGSRRFAQRAHKALDVLADTRGLLEGLHRAPQLPQQTGMPREQLLGELSRIDRSELLLEEAPVESPTGEARFCRQRLAGKAAP